MRPRARRERRARRRRAASMQLQRAAAALAFDAKERAFPVEAAGIAGEAPRAADDAVARHYDRDGIAPDRCADGAARRRHAELACDLAVRRRSSRRDVEERVPDRTLEVGSLQVERNVERRTRA